MKLPMTTCDRVIRTQIWLRWRKHTPLRLFLRFHQRPPEFKDMQWGAQRSHCYVEHPTIMRSRSQLGAGATVAARGGRTRNYSSVASLSLTHVLFGRATTAHAYCQTDAPHHATLPCLQIRWYPDTVSGASTNPEHNSWSGVSRNQSLPSFNFGNG